MDFQTGPEERARIRAQFPSLRSSTVFLENAGGSQVPKVVADRMREYLLNTYVQLGAGYELSQTCTRLVDRTHEFEAILMNARRGKVILGPSTSALLRMLADCYAGVLAPGREIVVAESGHEANISPWVRLERQGLKVVWWKLDPEAQDCPLDALDSLLSERAALVAFPHVSNLLGDIVDAKAGSQS